MNAARRAGLEPSFVGRTLDFDRFGLGGGPRLAAIFLVFGLIATVLLSLAMPPFQNPDEANHMLRADQIGRFGLLGAREAAGHGSGGLASPGIAKAAAAFDALKFHPERHLAAADLSAASAVEWGDPAFLSFSNTAVYPPIFYLPASIAIELGRATGLGILPTLTLARLATGCVATLLGALAIAIAGRGGIAIFALLTLPMSLELSSAVGQDGPMLAAAALAGALLWRGAVGRVPRFALWFLVLCVAIGLIAAARPPYLALTLLPLAMPRELSLGTRLAGCALILAIGLGWVWLASDAAAIDHDGALWPQLNGLVFHPWRVVPLVWQTLTARGALYRESFIGRLGWLDTALPHSYVRVAELVVLAAFVTAGARPVPITWRGATLILFAITISALGVFLVQYATWSALDAPVVDGVQGRYFLPLALVALPLSALLPRLGIVDRLLRVIICAFPLLTIAVVIRALLSRYYLS